MLGRDSNRESREISGNMSKTDGDDNSETAQAEEASCASYLQKLAVSLHSCGGFFIFHVHVVLDTEDIG